MYFLPIDTMETNRQNYYRFIFGEKQVIVVDRKKIRNFGVKMTSFFGLINHRCIVTIKQVLDPLLEKCFPRKRGRLISREPREEIILRGIKDQGPPLSSAENGE